MQARKTYSHHSFNSTQKAEETLAFLLPAWGQRSLIQLVLQRMLFQQVRMLFQQVQQDKQDDPDDIDEVPVDFSGFDAKVTGAGVMTGFARSPQHTQH